MRKINDRTGQTTLSKNGQKMTIIAYRRNDDIDIQFEDGTVVEHMAYCNFIKGSIENPNYKHEHHTKQQLKDRTGETTTTHNSQKMKIITYRNANDIDIQFENGTIVHHKAYASFKNGLIHDPTSKLGETRISRNNQTMTIIGYRNQYDMDVLFEDGTIVEHVPNNNFLKGSIKNPNYKRKYPIKDRTGETGITSDGEKIKIIAYRKSNDIDVLFEDGTIVHHKNYMHFKNGTIKKKDKTREYTKEDKIGKTNIANNGLKMKIVTYNNNRNIDIQFEDGTITTNKNYAKFKEGSIKHPTLSKTGTTVKGFLYNTRISGIAHNGNYTTHYNCFCPICCNKFIATFEGIKNHKCNLNHKNQELLNSLTA